MRIEHGLRLSICLAACTALAAQAQAPAALVQVDTVIQEPSSQTVSIIGQLVARQSGVVAARISGPVAELRVQVGDRVNKGQVIALLDTQELQVERDLAVGRLAALAANVNTAKAELALARQVRKRYQRLKDTQATSKAQYDDALQAEAIATARLRASEAALQSVKVAVRLAELHLVYARVKAPYSGAITQKLTEVGAYVQKGQDIVRMVANGSLEVEADIPFDRLGGMTPGAVVEISLDDGTIHQARVRAIIPEENRLTRTRAVRFIAEFLATGQSFAVHQSATVHVPLGAPREILTVHKDAVIKRGLQSLVYVVEEETARLRPVKLGEAVGSRFEVNQGLQAGEQVIVRGNERLRPNDKVQVNGE